MYTTIDLVKLKEKCQEANVPITIRTMLSDNCISITGHTLKYCGPIDGYKVIEKEEWINMDTIKNAVVDVVGLTIDNIIEELCQKPKN